MTHFPDNSFQKLNMADLSAVGFVSGAKRDLKITLGSEINEVKFKFSYDAMIKIGLALIASKGYKVRSVAGHHIRIIEKISQILREEKADYIGNRMRQIRNDDLYGGRVIISQEDSKMYYKFIRDIYKRAIKVIQENDATKSK